MHPYTIFLTNNEAGSLSTDQQQKLQRIISWRVISAWIMIIGFGLLAVGTTIPLLTGDLAFFVFWFIDCIYIVGFVWGIVLLVEQLRNKRALTTAPVHTVVGTPSKVNRAVAIPHVPANPNGIMLLKHLKAGVVKLNGKTYGTLPGLYQDIIDGTPATFYITPLRFGGIDGVIVNYT